MPGESRRRPQSGASAAQTENDDRFKEFLAAAPDGRTLNLDFESGDLRDWIAAGSAFQQQPIAGDTVSQRRSDMQSGHRGRYWIGTFEVAGDAPQGTLTSATIKVTHPFASFLVAGGEHDTTRVELVRKDTGRTVVQVSGRNHDELQPVVADLSKHVGEEIFIRLVDEHSGGWGHISFDHFRCHDEPPDFADAAKVAHLNSQMYDGLPAEEAARAMTLPNGFRVTAFAAEPDVKQPIAMTLDDRGRLWVAEAYAYPRKQPNGQGKDRILIFEDVDGDGRFDMRTVFVDGLNLVSGLEVGFGGVWVGQAPYLLFIPDRNGDDVPDGEPQVLLDGWHYEDTHETLNAFIWGPDGWLYGCHGVFTHSRVGKPGTPDEQRTPINAGIWRYHPTKHVFEVFAHGTSNPWGVDFNEYGHSFLTCCVIPHLFHVIQGARYHRQAGEHFNPFTYDDVKTIALHRHWAGNQWNDVDRARSDELGGGHAHAGAMIYQGGSWPDKYRNHILMNNIHGARLNLDRLSPKGSGYVGHRAPDFLLSNDRSSQILYFRYGPDGQVYMIDWYDNNQCHHGDPAKHDRTNGRIFKVSYRNAEPVRVDLQRLSSAELVDLQLHPNDWYVRHARRILQERGPNASVHDKLADIAVRHADETRRLRGLWALHVTGGLTERMIFEALEDDSPYVRGWAIQLAMESNVSSQALLVRFAELARVDPSQVVRLYLASALQRMDLADRWPILEGLLSHDEDESDHNLPLMYWYAMEPLCPRDSRHALQLAGKSEIPVVRSYALRRIADIGTKESVALLIESLGQTSDADKRLIFLNSINRALKGRRRFPMPDSWPPVAAKLAKSKLIEVRNRARALAVTFGDPNALAEMRRLLQDDTAGLAQRKSALVSLLDVRDPDLAPVLQSLINDAALRREALRGLAAYADPDTPNLIIEAFSSFDLHEKRDALNTLASRDEFALTLLAAVGEKKIAPADVSADVIRQLRNLQNEHIEKRIRDVWGIVRETAADKKQLIARYKRIIQRRGPAPDLHLGRALFAKHCQQCHKLFGTGETVGPELTGSNRADLDYLLSNALDPSAVMAMDYQPSIIVTEEGRTLTGLITQRNDHVLTVVTANETLTLPLHEIELVQRSDKSMMPDNLWQQLQPHEVRSLAAYLASPRQVAMLATADNVNMFFNRQNLSGWVGDPNLWSVENGEIIGRSDGLVKNEFLKSELMVADFELSLSVKLVPNGGNSGVQFRSEALPGGGVRGYQADVGDGWWGKLYEEHGRGLLWKRSGDELAKPDDWNAYRIVARGHQITTFLNGRKCVDLYDPQGAQRGIIALQLHAGPPMQVRFKDLKLTVGPQPSEAAEKTGGGE